MQPHHRTQTLSFTSAPVTSGQPPCPSGSRSPTNLQNIQLPHLQRLEIGFPLVSLSGSLAHLTQLEQLKLAGTWLDAELPDSLTQLRGERVQVNEWNAVAPLWRVPPAPSLRSLVVQGRSDENGTSAVLMNDLRMLTQLTELRLQRGPELVLAPGVHMGGWEGEEEEEDEEAWEGSGAGEQGSQLGLLPEPLRGLRHLTALQVLELDSNIEGGLAMPALPELRVSGGRTPVTGTASEAGRQAAVQGPQRVLRWLCWASRCCMPLESKLPERMLW